MNDNKNIQRQEEQTKEVINEIKAEYTKTADFLEDNTDTQLKIAGELKEELKNNAFEVNIEDLKAMLMEYRLTKGTGKFDSYIKLDIPQFVKDIPVDTVLSVKGNKETYKKFKNFAELHGVSVGTLFNYLIYSLLNSFNAW